MGVGSGAGRRETKLVSPQCGCGRRDGRTALRCDVHVCAQLAAATARLRRARRCATRQSRARADVGSRKHARLRGVTRAYRTRRRTAHVRADTSLANAATPSLQDGATPLHLAATAVDSPDARSVVALLLRAGADVGSLDEVSGSRLGRRATSRVRRAANAAAAAGRDSCW